MLLQTIYQVKDIIVQKHIFALTNEPYWLIRRGEEEFTTWDKPTLNYESLRKMILEYIEEKQQSIAADVENEDRREDEEHFWELDTEGV